jgi:hypothetical protein
MIFVSFNSNTTGVSNEAEHLSSSLDLVGFALLNL